LFQAVSSAHLRDDYALNFNSEGSLVKDFAEKEVLPLPGSPSQKNGVHFYYNREVVID